MPRLTDQDRLDILAAWAEERGYHVELGANEIDAVHPDTRVIAISRGQTTRSAVLALAHECGHVLGWEARERFFERADGKRSRAGKVAEIECEIDAWRRGWGLSERLGLGLSRASFEREAAKWVMTYVVKAAGSPPLQRIPHHGLGDAERPR